MSNPVCSIVQFFRTYDVRTMSMLSNDVNAKEMLAANIQFALDTQWSELRSIIGDRYPLANYEPPTSAPVPLILTKWVAATTAIRMFARRNDRPKQLDADEKWAEDWLTRILSGAYTIPDSQPTGLPALQDSDSFTGASAWDRVYGTLPPRAPQSANPGYQSSQSSGDNVST